MGWVKDLIDFLGGAERRKASAEETKARAEYQRVINTGLVELTEQLRKDRDFYRAKVEESERRIEELEGMRGSPILPEDQDILLEKEKAFHKEIIELRAELMAAKETIYFMDLDIKRLEGQRVTKKLGLFIYHLL